MKILLLADYYNEYLKQFYRENNYDDLTYDEHLEKLLDDYFGSFVSYYRHFKKIGYESKLIIANDYKLQNKWLKENNINLEANSKTKHKIVLMQIKEYNPNIFFMGSMFDYYGHFLKNVSEVTKNIFTWIACPYPENLDFSDVKCVFSSSFKYVETFRYQGINSEVLGAAFDADILNKIITDKTYDISFIGGLSKVHKERVASLTKLISKQYNINLFGYGLKKSFFGFFKSSLEKVYKGELWGIEMYKTLAQSNISLNFHIKEANGVSGNMRMYEATGCGSLLFTENTNDLKNIFEPNKEVIAYNTMDDLISKIDYYTKHKEEASMIANLGQKRCLENYGYDKRILDFENLLNKYID